MEAFNMREEARREERRLELSRELERRAEAHRVLVREAKAHLTRFALVIAGLVVQGRFVADTYVPDDLQRAYVVSKAAEDASQEAFITHYRSRGYEEDARGAELRTAKQDAAAATAEVALRIARVACSNDQYRAMDIVWQSSDGDKDAKGAPAKNARIDLVARFVLSDFAYTAAKAQRVEDTDDVSGGAMTTTAGRKSLKHRGGRTSSPRRKSTRTRK